MATMLGSKAHMHVHSESRPMRGGSAALSLQEECKLELCLLVPPREPKPCLALHFT